MTGAELERIQRDFCRSPCITTILPTCSSQDIDSSIKDQIMQGIR